MSADKKISVKSGLGSGDNVTDRHRKNGLRKNKERRHENLSAKRSGKSNRDLTDSQIKDLISTFPLQEFLQSSNPIEIVKKLVDVLRAPKSMYYFNQSNMYPEYDSGLFLFSNSAVLQRLVSFLNTSQDIELLTCVTDALIYISSHEEELTWSFEIVKHNFIPYGINLLDKCPSVEVKENIIWVFGNLMADNVLPRSRIVTFPRFQEVFVNTLKIALQREDQAKIVDVCVFAFNTALLGGMPYRSVKYIWDNVIEHALTAPLDIAVMRLILCGIAKGVHSHQDDFRLAVGSNDRLFNMLMKPTTQDTDSLIIISDIMGTLILTIDLHDKLLSNGILNLYTIFLNHKELVIRTCGCRAIENLIRFSENGIKHIFENKNLLNAIQRQFSITEDLATLKIIRMIIFRILAKAPMNHVYNELIKERKWDHYVIEVICNDYLKTSSPKLLLTALKALQSILKYGFRYIKERLEERDAITYLEQFSMEHPNKKIQTIAEEIVKRFDGMDLEED